MTFSYHRAVAPMLWVLIGLCTIEMAIVHAMVAMLWSRWVALALSLVSAGVIVWLTASVLSMRRRPVVLADGRLLMRVGMLKRVDVPLNSVAGLRERWDGDAIKRRDVLNLALVAYPNVVVDLLTPLPGRRRIAAVAHRLDDPGAFATALAQAMPA